MTLPPLWKPGLVWLLVLGPLFFLTYGFQSGGWVIGVRARPSRP